MYHKKSLFFPASLLLLAFTIIGFQSCGDDDIEGCTDVNAENYDPEATVDTGNCTYARDKFIGDYVAVFTCPTLLASISNDSLPVTIEPSIETANKSGIILTLVVNGGAVPLRGEVVADTLFIMDELMDVVIPDLPLIGTITGDVEGTGFATLSNNNIQLDGEVWVTITTAVLPGPISDNCTIVGVRQ